jgi:AraC family transcriptional regulator
VGLPHRESQMNLGKRYCVLTSMNTRQVMPHGQFLGSYSHRREARGFSFAELTPTVPAIEVRIHTHEDAHFVLLLSGDYISSARDAAHAQAGMLIYNPPGTTHRDRFRDLNGRFFTVSISADSLRHAAEYVPLFESATAFGPGPAISLAHRLVRECRQWAGGSPLVAEGISLELLSEMTHKRERRHRRPPRWLEDAKEQLDLRCAEAIHISEVAASVQVHPVHLIRTFREFFQSTPGEYLRRRRLEHAARLLVQGDLPLAQVALESGFADQSHFSKAFRRQFALAPGEYRRGLRRKMFVCDQSVQPAQVAAAGS